MARVFNPPPLTAKVHLNSTFLIRGFPYSDNNQNDQRQESSFTDKMLTNASRFLTGNLEKGFFAWGLTVARHPFPVIITAIITIIPINRINRIKICFQVILGSLTLSAILSVGLLNLNVEHQVLIMMIIL